jgi:hemerythrin-like domain-containing protein
MAVQIGEKKLATFDQPLEMLVDCHRRVEHFLDVMLRVEEIYRDRGLDEQGKRALVASKTYFSESAPKHTEDEEGSLFPRMRELLPQDHSIHVAIARLHADHQFADTLHRRIDDLLDEWQRNEGPLSPEKGEQLRSDLAMLRAHYADHIRVEEESVFPVAGQFMSRDLLDAMGQEMRQRRQV